MVVPNRSRFRHPPTCERHPLHSTPCAICASLKALGPEWIPVKHADALPGCECCNEPFCERCDKHFYECPCPGPSQEDEFEYTTHGGVLYARRKDGPHS